jgi:hypothetical protein
MVPSPYSHVLLEAVAQDEEAGQRTNETRCQRAPRCIGGNEQEGLPASCEDRSDKRGLVQRTSHETREYFNENTVDQDSPYGYGVLSLSKDDFRQESCPLRVIPTAF